ncbi:hypothetical protein D9613_010396 [Agrocybe pediades]|uniref:Uncharacterized protein n=1 Tax=Agrocybe pediades TaxID=84607 RepID=A0A8H4QGT2_9AGAR|nr:hypothetical protein D9613_010396 [Agrocybe pediades]
MADPLSITLAAITLGTALKDLTELALKLHESFKKHAHNMRAAESLAEDTLEIVQDIEKFYIERGDLLDNLPDVRDAVMRLSKDMRSVYDQCHPILQLANSLESRLRRTLFKCKQWWSREEVESNIRSLREQANKCYRRFKRHTQLGTVVAIGELKGAVSEGFSAITRQFSALQVSDANVLAFMGSTRAVLSTLPPDVMLSEDLVFKLYVRGHVRKLDDILKNLASKQSYPVEEPDDHHTQPFTTSIFLLFRTPEAIEWARGNAVTKLIRVQQGLLNIGAGGNPIQKGAWALNNLSVDLWRLEMHSESLILSTWTVDLYKTLSKSYQDVYALHLALACRSLATASYKAGDFAGAMAMTTESLSLLKTSAPTFATETLTAVVLSKSAFFRRAMGERSSASLQDAEDSVAMFERLGVDQMTVIGPQQRENYAGFDLRLTGGDKAVLNFAYALDLQRVLSYDSKRYQEAVYVGEKVLRLYQALGQHYKHINIQSKVASLCLFLCRDVFRDVIPLPSALKYAQEAVQIWEEVEGPTAAEEELILDTLAMQTKILVEIGRPSDALTIFQKLARRVRIMATNQRMYIHEMQDLASRLFSKKHYVDAATASRIIVKIYRQSADSLLTTQRFWINILLSHVKYCDYANHISEALLCNDEVLAIVGKQLMKDAAFTKWSLYYRLTYTARLSIEAGYPQQALNQIQGALNIGPAKQRHSIGCASEMLSLISLKALAFLRLGQLGAAVATITEGYDFYKSTARHLQKSTTRHLLLEGHYGELLYASALVYRCGGKQDDALTAIKAAIPIFESYYWDQLLFALSDVQADMGNDAKALHTAENTVQFMITEGHASSSSPILNHKYKTSQHSLCLRLFFNGEFTQARQVILEVRAFYEWHAHSRNAWFIDLARALRTEGILECASNRHAEGAAAGTRLNELQQRLRATHPDLAHQVDVDLNYERNYPAWKRILEKHPLTCSHWIEEDAITG